jgi:hypothetical protein
MNKSYHSIKEIRHINLLKLLEQYRSNKALAEAIERDSSFVSQLKNNYAFGDDIARHIEASLKLPLNYMDNQHNTPVSESEAINYHLSQALELSKQLRLTCEEIDVLKIFRSLDNEKKKVVKNTLHAMC